MKRILIIAVISAILCLAPTIRASAESYVDYVDPFIGTGGIGFGVGSIYPGPSTPFGMIKPGPDTSKNGSAPGFSHCAGYWYSDRVIRGFSHTRMHGTGVPDYGNVMLMPTLGDPSEMISESGYASRFKHKTEEASPGYYAVTLENTKIRVELTTGDYVAHHRYAYPDSESALLVLDASHFIGDGTPVETDVRVDASNREITGWFDYKGPFSGRGGGLKTYFLIQADTEFTVRGTWADDEYAPGASEAHATRAGAVVGFDASGGAMVEIKVAISFISVEQARANMKGDAPGWDFDALRARTRDAWERLLSRVRVEGGPERNKRTFYTALYHSLLMPTLFSEVGGDYFGLDKKVHSAKGFKYYSDFSTWDTFRTLHPLLVLVAPEYQRDFLVSLVKMYEDGGFIPRWPLGSNYTGCMIGTSVDVIMADSYLKGITDFDVDKAYEGLMKTANGPIPPGSPFGGRGGIADYLELGYVPSDKHGGATSRTLEFAFDDYSLSRLAAALGKYDDARRFLERSSYYRNTFNPATGFFDARRADGSFPETINDISWQDFYTEGTAWQWLWFVPHDVDGLIELLGGREAFLAKLDEFFSKSHKAPDTMMYDKWYWHGNEPDLYAAYLYLWAGRPDRTQEETRWISRKKYSDKPDGLDGNDDGGTLSAWYVMNAMGFMPIPATNKYFIGSPIFNRVTIDVAGSAFTIEAPNASGKKLYVRGATLNGAPLGRPYFLHSEIVDAGLLRLDMTATPGDWGKDMK